MGAKRNESRIFVKKPEGKRPLERPRHMWVDKWILRDRMGWCGLIWLKTGTSGGLL
jgi:hypothetical protein